MLSKLQKASDKIRWFVFEHKPLTIFRCQASTMTPSPKNDSPATIQHLYDLCQITFSPSTSSPPSSQAVQRLCTLLDSVGPADVGLGNESPDIDRGLGFGLQTPNRLSQWAQPITFLDIFESSSFTMCIFCFPTSAVIPLHDHPGMTVFSKIIYGSLHVKAYDWVDPPRRENKGQLSYPGRLAKLVKDDVLTAPCGTSVLYPKSGGNVHCFTALTPCAVLDVLAPPYKEDGGRGCTYFQDYPYATFSKGEEVEDGKEEDYAWLVQVDTPDYLYMRQGTYVGPPIRF